MTTADVVNSWFVEQIATGPIARNTEAYNQVLAAKDTLIARLDAATPAAAADPAPVQSAADVAAARKAAAASARKAAAAAARIATDKAALADDEKAAGEAPAA